jgi:hypothetical protein
MTWMLGMLGGQFVPPPIGSSGALMPIPFERTDSIPLALTATRQRADGPWTALAVLPNGARFEISIDAANRRGEFRSVAEGDDHKVLSVMAGLIASRP